MNETKHTEDFAVISKKYMPRRDARYLRPIRRYVGETQQLIRIKFNLTYGMLVGYERCRRMIPRDLYSKLMWEYIRLAFDNGQLTPGDVKFLNGLDLTQGGRVEEIVRRLKLGMRPHEILQWYRDLAGLSTKSIARTLNYSYHYVCCCLSGYESNPETCNKIKDLLMKHVRRILEDNDYDSYY